LYGRNIWIFKTEKLTFGTNIKKQLIMTTDQEEHHASNKLVVTEAEANVASTNLIPRFAIGIQKLKAFNARVDLIRPSQELDITGVTDKRKFTMSNLTKQTVSVAGAVHSYADDKGDLVLKKVVNFSKNKLRKLTQEEVISAADTVLTEAKKVTPADLLLEGISAAELKEYEEIVTYYRSISTSVRGAIIDRSGYTDELAQLFKQISALYKNSLDRLSHQYETKDEAFYHKYWAARKVIHHPGGGSDDKGGDDSTK
jgi:hypothetical protein